MTEVKITLKDDSKLDLLMSCLRQLAEEHDVEMVVYQVIFDSTKKRETEKDEL